MRKARRLATHIDGSAMEFGDLHGQDDQFIGLLSRLRELPDFEEGWIVLPGDLIDRGANPRATLDATGHVRREVA
jgi:hypothetical protein